MKIAFDGKLFGKLTARVVDAAIKNDIKGYKLALNRLDAFNRRQDKRIVARLQSSQYNLFSKTKSAFPKSYFYETFD